jgi:outer membrane protein assembly factor BamB
MIASALQWRADWPQFWRATVVVLAGVSVSACSMFGGGDDDEELEPVKLLKFEQTLKVQKLWSKKLGGGSEFLRIALSPASDGNRIYAASYDGKVSAYNPENGDQIWRTDLEIILSAGPGVGNGLVVVAGYDGELVALQAEDGTEAWRINIAGESLARPLIKDNAIVVYTIDGRLRVLSTFDGTEIWSADQSLPALTLRGAAAPVIAGSSVIAGFDNGRLVASNLSDGELQWEGIITSTSGRSDLERLSDLDGAMAVVGQDVYAAGYQGRVVALAAESGQVLWSREMSTYAGLAADWDNIYVVGDRGEIIALLRRNGSDVWRHESLLRRDPTAPVAYNTAIVVGDFEGYVHFFANTDGRPLARVRVGKGMISGAPVVAGGKLFIQSESGVLAAFVVPEPAPKGDAPEVAGDDEAETDNDADTDTETVQPE